VQAGQVTPVKFPAFNSWVTPDISAEVTQVSADTSWAHANLPPIYIVRLIIWACELAKLGSNKLKPGMPAEAFIHTRAQAPFSCFLKPFTGQFALALREG
jgi:multidrug efflux pump subunit AcrA (membrane-fusion protein)